MSENTVIGDIRRSWLRHWHSVIDDAFGLDPSFNFEAAHKDPYSDFRMHFMTWDLPDESLRRCFDVLPSGSAMCDRAIEMRSRCRANQSAMLEPEALELFRRGLDGLAHFVAIDEHRESLQKKVRVVRGPAVEIDKQVMHADRATVVLEYIDWKARLDPVALEAHWFLSETLYRLNNSYDVADYVDWPLFPDPQSADPHRNLALLALSDVYYALLNRDGPVLFVVTDRARD